VQFETVQSLLALAAIYDWEILALGIKSPFLYGKLEEEIYMQPDKRFLKNKNSSKIWRLCKALYSKIWIKSKPRENGGKSV